MTLLDDATMSDEYRDRIMENRRYYANKHGKRLGVENFWISAEESSFDQATVLSFHKLGNMISGIHLGVGQWCQGCGMR